MTAAPLRRALSHRALSPRALLPRALPVLVASLAACAAPRHVTVEDLEGASVEIALETDAARFVLAASRDGDLPLPVALTDGTPFRVSIARQPDDPSRRCAAPLREFVAGDSAPRVRCRVRAVCARLAETRLPREVRLEEAFAALPRPGRDAEEPPSFASLARADGHLYLGSHRGRIYRFEDRPDVERMTLALDLSDRVRDTWEGLVALALHPRFEDTPQLFVQYVTREPLQVVLARFDSDDGGVSFDPDSEARLIAIDKPRGLGDHNGGLLRFGPDGMLYAGFGDGGLSFPPLPYAQRLDTLLGTVVRLDVDRGADEAPHYAVPPDNPFVDTPDARPEIWAYGQRNPFRGAFDSEGGGLFVGDVGGDLFEEVNRVERGGNYGWPIAEGDACVEEGCDLEGLAPPIHSYPHSAPFHAVIGGPVYRGSRVDGLAGSLIFADFQTREVWAGGDPYGEMRVEPLGETEVGVVDILERPDGELYLLANDGSIYAMAPAGEPVDAPSRLSETGCMDPHDVRAPRAGFVPYEVAAPLWSDGAAKRRWVFLPDGERAALDPRGDARLPVGSALIKEFSRDGRPLETRVVVRAEDRWVALSYRWDDDLEDATLVREPVEATVGGAPWLFPDATQCPTCHTRAAGFALGLEARQLLGVAGAYERLAFHRMVPEEPTGLAPLARPHDEAADVGERARAFLHANCAGCHRPDHPLRPSIDLRRGTPLDEMGLCAPPRAGDLGLGATRVVTPGDPDASLLLRRLEARGDDAQMPPLSTYAPPPQAALVRAWIRALPPCEDD